MTPISNDDTKQQSASVWPSSADAPQRAESAPDIVSELNQLIEGFRTLVGNAEAALAEALGKPAEGLRLAAPPPVQRYVTQNPWRAVAVAAAIGAALAYLMPRR